MDYILVVDDEADIREIMDLILRRSFPLDVVLAESGNKAIEIIKLKGVPKVIISDMNMPDGDGSSLYKALQENNWNIPFIVCSTDAKPQLSKNFPDIHGFIEKPDIIEPAVKLVASALQDAPKQPEYVGIRISLLLRWGVANYDLYMKLSDSKFVKVLKANDAFLPSDAERFSSKSLQFLFITRSDADAYIKNFQKNIQLLVGSKPKPNTELSIITVEALETVTSLSRALGWKPEVMEAAKYAVELAIKAVSAEPDVLKLLKHKMSDPSSNYASHVSIISLMACGFCHSLGWHSEMAQMKLGLAAMVHDITVDESYYSDIHKWNAVASEVTDKSSAAMKYRNHPLDAATLILQMKNVVPDVDQIVLQHHEAKDGSGFPRRLTSSRISPMACIFIITEDFVNFIDNGPDINEKIDTFIFSRETKYNSGNFKKIFDAIKESIQRSRAHHS